MGWEILVILVLMLLNGVFAGAEIAILSLRKTRIAELVEQRARGARAVQWLRNEPEQFLATVQVGITVVTTTAAAFGGERLAKDFGGWLGRVPGLGPFAGTIGFFAVVAGISYLGVVVGELVPKSLALRSAERYALIMGPFLRAMATATKPAVWLLTGSSNLVLKLFGDKTSFVEGRLSPEEIQEIVEEAARTGSLDEKTSEIASRAMDFRELRAADVMVPRTRMVSLAKEASREDLRAIHAEHHYARMPVYEGSPENIVGYLTLRDLVEPALAGHELSIERLMRPPRFVPESAMAAPLLKQMQSERVPLSIVVDENGAVRGLVTIEDLVEELVGDILSEHDPAPISFHREPDGSVVVPGTTPIREVNRAMGVELPEPEGCSTLAGLCIHGAEAIPRPHTVLPMPDGTVLEVVEASPRRVRSVRVRPAEDKAD